MKHIDVWCFGINTLCLGLKISECVFTENFSGWDGLGIAFVAMVVFWLGGSLLKD